VAPPCIELAGLDLDGLLNSQELPEGPVVGPGALPRAGGQLADASGSWRVSRLLKIMSERHDTRDHAATGAGSGRVSRQWHLARR
jgi:hypothetical protein